MHLILPLHARSLRPSQDLKASILPELEALKLSLVTRSAPDPVAQSRNRPADVVRLSGTAALPEMDWGPAAPPPRNGVAPLASQPPAMNVDDLLDILSPSSSRPSQQQAPPPPPPPPPGLPEYQPRYTSSSREMHSKHDLFYPQSAAAAGQRQAVVATPGTSSAAAASSQQQQFLQRYPDLVQEQQRLPPPTSLDADQMRRLNLSPTAGPSLGPQEIEVRERARTKAGCPNIAPLGLSFPVSSVVPSFFVL